MWVGSDLYEYLIFFIDHNAEKKKEVIELWML
jgi:hypothetical protein